ncbi:MAG TPA: MFS transporter [Candidatus Didemnitutus sp.]|nr:MFS transporter [Candidatus Didemnitutus sp.]
MTVASPPLATRYRWTICALLFFATTINYIDRQIMALIKPILDQQLHWTNEQYGTSVAFFSGAYAVSLLLFGWFVDRFGTKIGYAASIIGWSIAAMGHALVGSVGGFYLARTALGFGEGGNFPSAIKSVAVWFPKKERALATSIFNSGTNVGAIIAPLVVPWIAQTWGWHWAFVLAGLAGLLWLALWLPFYHLPDRAPQANAAERAYIRSDTDDAGRDEDRISWTRLLRYRQTWSFVVAKALTDPVWWFFLTWLPDFFMQTRHLDITHSSGFVAAIYAIATVLGIIGGWLVGFLVHRGWSVTRARKTGMFFFACCAVPILLVKSVGDWPAVLLIGFACAAHQAWSANLFTTASDMFPRRAVASVVGLGGMAGSGMNILFPILAGRLLDVFKAQGNVSAGYGILFALCGFSYLTAFVIQHLLAPRFEMVDLDRA